MPPRNDFDWPTVDTVTSTRWPGFAKAGSSAVTITGAVFLPFRSSAELGVTPNWEIRERMDCNVSAELPSPVPGNPTTSPYPTSWFGRTPAIEVRSFSLSASTICGYMQAAVARTA